MAEKGWILLHRKIKDSAIWNDGSPFDGRSAWIDLLLMANHEDREICVNNQPLIVHRGQKFTSFVKLAERWHWSRQRVMRYMKKLKSFGMLNIDSTSTGTLLTIEKYDDYQTVRTTVDTTVVTPVDTTPITTVVTQTNNYKELEKNEERKEDGEWVRPQTNPDGVPWQ